MVLCGNGRETSAYGPFGRVDGISLSHSQITGAEVNKERALKSLIWCRVAQYFHSFSLFSTLSV